MTKSQINKLGERLRTGGSPDLETLARLQEFRASYAEPLAKVQSLLRTDLHLEPVSRLKTPNTIVEKLRRDRTRLATMRDIAGVRVITDQGIGGQEVIVEMLSVHFPEARIEDRRVDPNHGYRAVHVIPEVDGRFVEIQVRTVMQDLWAQAMEKLADELGRGIRYGDVPEQAADRVTGLIELSATIHALENIECELRQLQLEVVELGDSELQAKGDQLRLALKRRAELVRASLRAILGSGGSSE